MGTGYSPYDLEVVRRTGQLPSGARDRARGRTAPPPDGYGALYGAPYSNPERANYAGFGTAGEFTDYVRGRGLTRYDEAQDYAAELARMADPYDLSASTNTARNTARSAYEALMPSYMDVPEARAEMLRQADVAGPGAARGAEHMLTAPVDRNLRVQATPPIPATTRSFVARADSGPDPAARGMSVALGGTWEPSRTDKQIVATRDGVNYVLPSEPLYTATVGPDGGMADYAAMYPNQGPVAAAAEPYTIDTIEAKPAVAATYRNLGQELFDQYVGPDAEAGYNAYLAELDKWYADTADQYAAAMLAADETAGTMPHEWMQRVAIDELGVDPAMAAGAFGPGESASYFDTIRDLRTDPIEDFGVNQDLLSMEQTGMPYDDALAYSDRIRAEQDRAERDYRQGIEDLTEAEMDSLYRSITETTGLSGEALAQSTDIDPAVLNAIVTDQSFADALAELEAVAATGDITKATEASRNLMAQDSLVWRVVRALRPDLLEPVDYYGVEG